VSEPSLTYISEAYSSVFTIFLGIVILIEKLIRKHLKYKHLNPLVSFIKYDMLTVNLHVKIHTDNFIHKNYEVTQDIKV